MSPRPLPPSHSEPLTPDERAWAERLRQAGPHAGPPPALDAQILAAAHAAVARRPPHRASPRRWPTMVGAAASLVIVVGLAWQLQPLLRTRPSLGEAPVATAPLPRSEGSLSPDVLAAADPVAKRAVDSPPPPPAPTVATTRRQPASPPPPAVPARRTPARRTTAFGDDAIPPYADYAGKAATRQAAAPAASQAAANDATARASRDERRERAAAAASPPPPPMPAARADAEAAGAMSAAAPPSEAQAAAESAPTLDRIAVSGSRMSLAGLPVSDDARLEPAAWLQRIRDRRDAGDLDGARDSLALFRRNHPRVRLPDDLARLVR